ncbi:MAG: DUF4339 domain-containing protein [Litorimonas sp.]
MEGHRTAQTENAWYVSVDGQTYGPFDDTALWSFVREGRVTAQSNVSRTPTGPFAPALSRAEIAHWFGARRVAAPVAPPSLLLVMADLRSSQSIAFLQTLQAMGTVERVGEAVWLLQTRDGVEHARSVLVPTLSAIDGLVILDATQADIATANLGDAAVARIDAMKAAVSL